MSTSSNNGGTCQCDSWANVNKKYFMGQHAHGVQQWRIGNSYARREVRHIMSFCNRTGSSCVRNLHAHGERLLVDYGVGNSHDLQVCEKRTAKVP